MYSFMDRICETRKVRISSRRKASASFRTKIYLLPHGKREREKEKLNKKHRRKRNNGAGKKDICVHVWGELAGVRVP